MKFIASVIHVIKHLRADEGNDSILKTSRLKYVLVFFEAFVLYFIYQKPKISVVWEGRPNFSFLFKSCEILVVRGDLSINVEDKKSLRVDRQACKNYALALVLCAFNNSKSI